MQVRIQKLDPHATLPNYAHTGDAGMDVYSNEDVTLAPQERRAIKTGIAMGVPEGYVALVWDKSGRALKEGLTTMAGVVDAGYRGEVMIVMLNTSSTNAEIKKGQKLAQILVQPVASPELVEVDSLDETDRSTGGFGSTGL
ncbi:MAG: dUTP diphosphatase [Candidatus Kerfeldbacteria bacterium]|nr:dUTP diphosphatase [Candidatus Kerfeldbacteria bacterium]